MAAQARGLVRRFQAARIVSTTAAKATFLGGHNDARCWWKNLYVIPCFNQAKFLPFSIRSALMQTLPAHEVIVINDGSSDDTEQIVSAYPSVRYAYQQNKGVAAARNLGASIAQGEYLLFLDADDQLLPKAVEVGSTILATRPEFGLVYGRSRVIDFWGNLIFEHPKDRTVQHLL